MSTTPLITNITRKSYYQLIKIHQIEKYLTKNMIKSLIHSFSTRDLDYFNSLLVNLPEKKTNLKAAESAKCSSSSHNKFL